MRGLQHRPSPPPPPPASPGPGFINIRLNKDWLAARLTT